MEGPLKRTGLRGADLCVLKPPLLVPSKITWCKPLSFRAALLVLKHDILVQLLSFPPRTF